MTVTQNTLHPGKDNFTLDMRMMGKSCLMTGMV